MGNERTAGILLRNGADPQARDSEGKSPLERASGEGVAERIRSAIGAASERGEEERARARLERLEALAEEMAERLRGMEGLERRMASLERLLEMALGLEGKGLSGEGEEPRMRGKGPG